MKQALAALLLVSLLFAGCSDKGAPAADDDETFDDLIEDPPASGKGVIRGLVLDEAVFPIEGATVSIVGTSLEAQTNQNGAFAFTDLEPGTYFLQVAKVGYHTAQVSAQVVADEAKPALTRATLLADASQLPFVEQVPFNGLIVCSVSTSGGRLNACAQASGAAGLGETNTFNVATQGYPTFVQAEMRWESTQPAGDGMFFEVFDGSSFSPIETEGVSPLVIRADRDVIENGTGTWKPGQSIMRDPEERIAFRAFAGSHPLLMPPVCPADAGVSGVKCWGNGVTVDQAFEVYVSVFYRVVPPEDYLFIEDGAFRVES